MQKKPLNRTATIKGSKGNFTVLWNGDPGTCKYCSEEIGFGMTDKGKWLPFDFPEHENDATEPHFATCENYERPHNNGARP